MALFAVEDMLIKFATQTLYVGTVCFYFGAGGMIGFALLSRLWGENLLHPNTRNPIMVLRFFSEIMGRLFYFLALALIPLSTATVIMQATPLVVVAAASVFMKEPVGIRRWVAILIGMLGVIVIVQPGSDAFSMVTLLAVIGMLGFAGRDLLSRAAPAALGTATLGFYGFLAITVAGLSYTAWEQAPITVPDTQTALYLMIAIGVGIVAYTSLMKAMRTGDVSYVTPFRYTRLLFGVGLGILFFSETLTTETVIGSLLILASGLFIMWRSRQV